MSTTQFISIYNSLPAEAQRTLLERHLVPLLASVSQQKANDVLSVAKKLKTRVTNIPILDLKGKKKEIDTLLDALNRDAKISIMRERSNREELMSEVIDSLVSWLSDIWSVVYEYHENYLLAHGCLLLCVDVLQNLSDMPGVSGCKCSMSNLSIRVAIRKQNGKLVKSFDLQGPHSIDEPLLWIWRDLFVSALAHGSQSVKDKLPDLLEDIGISIGWTALERLFYGGKREDEDDEDEDEDDESDCFSSIIDDDNDSSYTDASSPSSSSSSSHCPCPSHAPHWPDALALARPVLLTLIESALHTAFALQPSLPLYNTILSLTPTVATTNQRLLRTLASIAPNTPDTLVAALHIYSSEADAPAIAALLATHSHLLRPRDAESLQCAVAVLASSPFSPAAAAYTLRGLQILERELTTAIHAIATALHATFPLLTVPPHRTELLALLALPAATPPRADRLSRWSATVLTSPSGPMHPMAFAAMMMGIPLMAAAAAAAATTDPMDGGAAGVEAEAGAFLDMYGSDPDLEDLREEFRPRLKERFEGWVRVVNGFSGGKGGGAGAGAGAAVAGRAYEVAVGRMPFLKGPDVVEVMLVKLRDRPSKNHVLVAIEALWGFCKKTTKRLEKQRRAVEKEAAAARRSGGNGGGAPSTARGPIPSLPFPFTFTASPPSGSGRSDGGAGGGGGGEIATPGFFGVMDDVD